MPRVRALAPVSYFTNCVLTKAEHRDFTVSLWLRILDQMGEFVTRVLAGLSSKVSKVRSGCIGPQ